jgi:hypothetical protein
MKEKTPVKDRKGDHGKTDPTERVRRLELVWGGENAAEWQVTIGPVVYKPRKPNKGSGHKILCEMLSLIIEAAQEQSIQASLDGDAASAAEADSFIDQASADRQKYGC